MLASRSPCSVMTDPCLFRSRDIGRTVPAMTWSSARSAGGDDNPEFVNHFPAATSPPARRHIAGCSELAAAARTGVARAVPTRREWLGSAAGWRDASPMWHAFQQVAAPGGQFGQFGRPLGPPGARPRRWVFVVCAEWSERSGATVRTGSGISPTQHASDLQRCVRVTLV